MSHLLRIVLQEVLQERERERRQAHGEGSKTAATVDDEFGWKGTGVIPPKVPMADAESLPVPGHQARAAPSNMAENAQPYRHRQRSSSSSSIKPQEPIPVMTEAAIPLSIPQEPRSQQAIRTEQRFLSGRKERYGKKEMIAWGPEPHQGWETDRPTRSHRHSDENQKPSKQQRKPASKAPPPRRKFHIGVNLPYPCTGKDDRIPTSKGKRIHMQFLPPSLS